MIDNAAIKQWFGNSVLKDERNNPLIVYHGSARDITHFKVSTNGLLGRGIYFTGNPADAADYARSKDGGDTVYPVMLRIENPVRIDARDGWEHLYEIAFGKPPRNAGDEMPSDRQAREMVRRLQEMGHDGVISTGVDPALGILQHYSVFSPEQVEFAYGAIHTSRNTLNQTAYHGTSHYFDRFSLDHIGRGEGAQSFGWGLYFTDTREVAEHYQRTISSDTMLVADGSMFYPSSLEHLNVRVTLDRTGDLEAAIARAIELIQNDHGAEYARKDLEVLQNLKARGGLLPNPGHLYTVYLPDDGDYLLWDKPLREQPGRVLELLDIACDRVREGLDDSFEGEVLFEVVYDMYEDASLTGRDLYEKLAYGLGGYIRQTYNIEENPERASRLLNRIGLVGIKYLDGVSRDADSGSFNYVIFDDAAIEILARNDQEIRRLNQRVFHGSPHHFDRFSLKHFGNGEGAAAYGWGLYFTDTHAIAEYYKTITSVLHLRGVDGKKYGDTQEGAEETAKSLLLAFLREIQTFEAYEDGGQSYMGKIARDIRKGIIKPAPGKVYHAEIPEDDTFLLWDQPMSKQPPKVRKAFQSLEGKYGDYVKSILEDDDTGEVAYRHLGNFNRNIARVGDGNEDAASSADLFEVGISGVKYPDGASRSNREGAYNYVVFSDSVVEILNSVIQEGLGSADNKRGTFSYADDIKLSQSVITLLKDADLSTFIHESAHFYLEVMSDMASQADAPAPVTEDMKVILKWLGVDEVDWYSMPAGEKVEFHEKFARGFEAYVLEGKSPSKGLQGIFEQASGWMKRVYCNIRNLDVELNEDIRLVFDRMLAEDTPKVTLGCQKELNDIAKGFERQLAPLEAWMPSAGRVYSRMVSAFYDVQSQRLGITPKEMLDRYQLKIDAAGVSRAKKMRRSA